MDFSSISRALESLHRRQPPLSDQIILISKELYATLVVPKSNDEAVTTTNEATTTTTTVAISSSQKIVQLLQELMGDFCTPPEAVSTTAPQQLRWESLAVGLYIATEIILAMTTTVTTTTSTTTTSVVAEKKETTITNTTIMPPVYMDGPRVPITTTTPHPIPTSTAVVTSTTNDSNLVTLTPLESVPLIRTMHMICIKHLEHSEPRVRTLVAKAVGAYSALIIQITTSTSESTTTLPDHDNHELLVSYLTQMHTMLLHSIEHHIQVGRSMPVQPPTTSEIETTTTTSLDDTNTTNPMMTANNNNNATVVDDTTGWRAIETNWLCLASFLHGVSDQYYYRFPLAVVNYDDDENNIHHNNFYSNCSYSAIQHVNRHVRAAAMQTYEQLIHVITLSILKHPNDTNIKLLLSDPTSILRTTLIDIVKTGLADNWSQVRMASSVLCRVWFQSLITLDIPIDESIMMAALLPRMCLNRFYLAQGVKLYSHETWKMIFGSSSSSSATDSSTTTTSLGLRLVVENINAMIRYYIKMCDADNHAVREAACQAIAELAVRVGTNIQYRNVVLDATQISNLIAALLMCFYDESWPVRDEACLACGILCKAFPDACHSDIFHKTLWERFTEQLTDQIWSVRENAAVAIGDVLEAYGEEILPKIQTLIEKLLPCAKEQPSMSASEYKAHVNDLNQHTDNQLYSCGSLAPKLRKGGAGRIGCTNCGIDRPKAPWEATDGCIYLLREYIIRRTAPDTTIPISDDELIPLCTELADVCRVRHFPQSDELRSTLWKCLPIIAVTLGQKRFKNRYLDIFLDLLFSNLESSSASQLSHHAAGQCAEELASLIGMNMFRARLEDHQRDILDEIVRERQMMPKGPAGGSDIFSPFGPPGLLVDIVPP